MSQWDIKGLETNFEGFRTDRYPSLPVSEAFERFAIRQVLKDADLSDDEIESGIFAGQDDGGVDGLYFFVNRALIQDETDLPDDALSAELVIIQAKLETGFSETAVTKLEAFSKDLLDHNRDVDAMVHLNAAAREAIRRFRDFYTKILASPHTMNVSFAYATKSDQQPNTKVAARVKSLEGYIKSQLSNAKFAFEFWGAQRLLAAARRAPNTTEMLDISKQFTADDGSAVCLVKLGSLAKLLRDEHGDVRRNMLEPNVRDYQGSKNIVNTAIRQSLAETTAPEFWWLNNGVTILASKCSVVGNKIVIEKPEVVNGLQTSYEIFQFFKDQPDKADSRNVLVRVIVPPDEQIRSKIIRATNSQTPINEVSLRATDPIHFDIEEKFRLYGLFYERRKGEYRELKKPVDQIISIQTLARAVIAILLQQPNNAYATPSRVLKSDYDRIFSESHNRDMFVTCMLIHRQVDKYIGDRGDDLKDVRSIIRYFVSMAVSCTLLNKTAPPSDKELASLLATSLKPIDARLLKNLTDLVTNTYVGLGGTESVAKGPEMRGAILKKLGAKLTPVGSLGI
ncbi:hypothetical protein ACVIHI_003469 [Bradyrhizobium sp. USDA 4524]|uniref:AIPR family protein n=1 Tax=unclassified Bradyrhizobium TaxID=2631580 RepID=UPI00209DC3F6|nr:MULTISPECIES: AIPR family protein [unclassified Bradyrhizobium]MCP1843613.1 hypothetical protein [Bradyrhizobium sp. USDA 4538]MCP1904179.1 hypothetical protein [Bradyrhizobium sp. USDA 4537]MCP1990165.1 hypothetical protein [Bradyrhizobium sp. USDA 4539]